MNKNFVVGQFYEFIYDGKLQDVKVEKSWVAKNGKRCVLGYSYSDKGYRTFHVEKMLGVEHLEGTVAIC